MRATRNPDTPVGTVDSIVEDLKLVRSRRGFTAARPGDLDGTAHLAPLLEHYPHPDARRHEALQLLRTIAEHVITEAERVEPAESGPSLGGRSLRVLLLSDPPFASNVTDFRSELAGEAHQQSSRFVLDHENLLLLRIAEQTFDAAPRTAAERGLLRQPDGIPRPQVGFVLGVPERWLDSLSSGVESLLSVVEDLFGHLDQPDRVERAGQKALYHYTSILLRNKQYAEADWSFDFPGDETDRNDAEMSLFSIGMGLPFDEYDRSVLRLALLTTTHGEMAEFVTNVAEYHPSLIARFTQGLLDDLPWIGEDFPPGRYRCAHSMRAHAAAFVVVIDKNETERVVHRYVEYMRDFSGYGFKGYSDELLHWAGSRIRMNNRERMGRRPKKT